MIAIEPIGYVRRDAGAGGGRGLLGGCGMHHRCSAEALMRTRAPGHRRLLACRDPLFFDQVEERKILPWRAQQPDWPRVGIFAQRGKNRPNRIGSHHRARRAARRRVLHVAELDAIDNTPVLDIKPVMQELPAAHGARCTGVVTRTDARLLERDDGFAWIIVVAATLEVGGDAVDRAVARSERADRRGGRRRWPRTVWW